MQVLKNIKGITLGEMFITYGVSMAMSSSNSFYSEISNHIQRYLNCDWAEMSQDDIKSNEAAMINGERILAAYKTSKGKIFIETSSNRRNTTIMFADEY